MTDSIFFLVLDSVSWAIEPLQAGFNEFLLMINLVFAKEERIVDFAKSPKLRMGIFFWRKELDLDDAPCDALTNLAMGSPFPALQQFAEYNLWASHFRLRSVCICELRLRLFCFRSRWSSLRIALWFWTFPQWVWCSSIWSLLFTFPGANFIGGRWAYPACAYCWSRRACEGRSSKIRFIRRSRNFL